MKNAKAAAQKKTRQNIPVTQKAKQSHALICASALEGDGRLQSAPRAVHMLSSTGSGKPNFTYFLKLYGGLSIPGAELVTLSAVSDSAGKEWAMRYDQHFPVPLQFKKLDDSGKLEAVRKVLETQAGSAKIEKALQTLFAAEFPKFGV